jgi:hypothetical protein
MPPKADYLISSSIEGQDPLSRLDFIYIKVAFDMRQFQAKRRLWTLKKSFSDNHLRPQHSGKTGCHNYFFSNYFFTKYVSSHLENRVLETKKLFFNHNGEI